MDAVLIGDDLDRPRRELVLCVIEAVGQMHGVQLGHLFAEGGGHTVNEQRQCVFFE